MPGREIRPEQAVIDAIDELVNESLAHGPTDDYNEPFDEHCPVCDGEWHGLPYEVEWGGCPGTHATPEQREAYLSRLAARRDELKALGTPGWDAWTEIGYIERESRGPTLQFSAFDEAHRIDIGTIRYVCQVSDVWLSHDLRCRQCQRHLGTVTTNIEQLEVLCPECQDMINRSRGQGDSQ